MEIKNFPKLCISTQSKYCAVGSAACRARQTVGTCLRDIYKQTRQTTQLSQVCQQILQANAAYQMTLADSLSKPRREGEKSLHLEEGERERDKIGKEGEVERDRGGGR